MSGRIGRDATDPELGVQRLVVDAQASGNFRFVSRIDLQRLEQDQFLELRRHIPHKVPERQDSLS